VDVHSSITHVADDDLIFLIVESTDTATLAIWALPGEKLHKVRVKWWLMARTMVSPAASATLNTILLLIKCKIFLAFLADDTFNRLNKIT
jgi:hypothetical protein